MRLPTPKLFPYQIEGAKWLSTKKIALLADEMGLGKSAQSIVAAHLARAKSILVVCRAVAKQNWLNEFQKFWPDSFQPSLEVTSYEGLHKIDPKKIFDILIVDESQYVKEPNAKRTQSVLGKTGAIRRCKQAWFLTGTPTPNSNAELWPLLYVANRTRLSYQQFVDTYCIVRETGFGRQICGNNRERTPELKRLLNGFALRRTKEGVNLQLPAIFFQDIVVPAGEVKLGLSRNFAHWVYPKDLTKELDKILEKELGVIGGIFKGGFTDAAMEALQARAKSISTLRMYTGLRKVQPVIDLVTSELESKAYEKIVLFTWHKDVSEGLRSGLKKYGAQVIYGGSDPEKRDARIATFQNVKNCRVLVANIQTAGTSINLTAANQAMFVESSFVPADIHQAAARCHRIGQTKPVTIRFCGLANSLDQHIMAILRRKTIEIAELMGDTQSLQSVEQKSPLPFEPITNINDIL